MRGCHEDERGGGQAVKSPSDGSASVSLLGNAPELGGDVLMRSDGFAVAQHVFAASSRSSTAERFTAASSFRVRSLPMDHTRERNAP